MYFVWINGWIGMDMRIVIRKIIYVLRYLGIYVNNTKRGKYK